MYKYNSKESASHDTYRVGKVCPCVVVEVAAYEVHPVPLVGEVESFQPGDGTSALVACRSEDRLETLAAVHRLETAEGQSMTMLLMC